MLAVILLYWVDITPEFVGKDGVECCFAGRIFGILHVSAL